MVAFCLHAVAIAFGALALVQPVIVSAIVVAVLVRAGLDRRLPSRRELGWASVTWAGLALFMAVVHPAPAQGAPDGAAALSFAAVAVVAAGASVWFADRAGTPERRGLWLGTSAGVLFGLVAGLLKMSMAAPGPVQLLLSWPVWVMVVVGLWAMTMNQRAYQVTRLSVSMPVLNIVDVVVALGFASVVFGERVASSPAVAAAELVGLVAMGVGVRQLARGEERPRPPEPAQPLVGTAPRSPS